MKHLKMLELQKLKMQTCKKIELQKFHRAPKMCWSLDNSTMTIHILLLLLLLLLKILTNRGLVYKIQNTFLKIKNVSLGVQKDSQIMTILIFGPRLGLSMNSKIMVHCQIV